MERGSFLYRDKGEPIGGEAMPTSARINANNRANLLETIIYVKNLFRDEAIEKALECARIAKETGSEPHAREAISQREHAEHLTKSIERNRKELDELRRR